MSLIEDGLRKVLSERSPTGRADRVLPRVRSATGGLMPGMELDDSAPRCKKWTTWTRPSDGQAAPVILADVNVLVSRDSARHDVASLGSTRLSKVTHCERAARTATIHASSGSQAPSKRPSPFATIC